MSNSAMEAGVTGILTISVAGINIALSHADLLNWGNSIMSLAPLLLILFLIWRMYKLDQQHKGCQDSFNSLQQSHNEMQEKLIFAYMAIQKTNTSSCPLPSVKEFISAEPNKEILND